jgi:hypothetical protein
MSDIASDAVKGKAVATRIAEAQQQRAAEMMRASMPKTATTKLQQSDIRTEIRTAASPSQPLRKQRPR